jgi:hypothetical protein
MDTPAEGYLGRECPSSGCLGYFKVTLGTGLPEPGPCHCPYCGHEGANDSFWTQEQIEYAESVVLHQVTEALLEDLRGLEFDHRAPPGGFGFGMSLKVSGQPHAIRDYREKRLETEVVCDVCRLRYAIYGVFAFCPDCGVHNSLQILQKNLDLYEKVMSLAADLEGSVAEHLTGNALEDAVAAFDGFGRETCRVRAQHAATPGHAESLSFQNLTGARKRLQDLFTIDLATALAPDEWAFCCRAFQKRHLLAHSMGVVDDAYLHATGDLTAVAGRKVTIASGEVASLIGLLRKLGATLLAQLPAP